MHLALKLLINRNVDTKWRLQNKQVLAFPDSLKFMLGPNPNYCDFDFHYLIDLKSVQYLLSSIPLQLSEYRLSELNPNLIIPF